MSEEQQSTGRVSPAVSAGAVSYDTARQQPGDGQKSPNSPLPDRGTCCDGEEELTEEEQALLDEETRLLLEDMQKQEAELEGILNRHKQDAKELGSIRDAMAQELKELKEESWRLEALGDLEMMRGKLEGLLDEREAEMAEPLGASDGSGPSAEAAAAAAEGPTTGEPTSEDVSQQMASLLEMEEQQLDMELEAMQAQLKDIKQQALDMDKRRQELVAQLEDFEMPPRWDADEAAADQLADGLAEVSVGGNRGSS